MTVSQIMEKTIRSSHGKIDDMTIDTELYDRYDGKPCIKPDRNIQYWKQLYQVNRCKNDIRERIQP